jgi:hypothetical protein
MESFDNIWKLVGVPVITVQLRYNGWVTEMQVLLLPTSTLTRSYWQCCDSSAAVVLQRCLTTVTLITAQRVQSLIARWPALLPRLCIKPRGQGPHTVKCCDHISMKMASQKQCLSVNRGHSTPASRQCAPATATQQRVWTTCCTARTPTFPASLTWRSPPQW